VYSAFRMRVTLVFVALLVLAAPAQAATTPPPLSKDTGRADIRSTYGSGAFGTWTTDGSGLPAYRYTLDQAISPLAPQPELAGRREAWHQLGNDRAIATAYNDGNVALWSQDRSYEWLNKADPASGHYGGGYGYLRLGGRTYSTLYADRARGAKTERLFGAGYFGRRTEIGGATVAEKVYAPFGDDPVLLHDVTVTNTSSARETASWFEYWDVNPESPAGRRRATAAPAYDAAARTLSVAQLPDAEDRDPLSIFAAALSGPVDGVGSDGDVFFGAGGRASPDAVAANRLAGPGAAPGTPMFAFRAPLSLEPGASVTLRYAYGYGHPRQIAPLVARWRAAADPFAASQKAWAKFVPQASFGSKKWSWLSRELQWDAYTLRSGTSYEECAGRHILSQGGYYQYGLNFQGAFRDPLQHVLPLVYAAPGIAREVLLYSAGEQPRVGFIPYSRFQNCARYDLGTSDDLDLWLLWTAAEYGLATRDVAFFDRRVPWADGGSGTFWEHLKRSVDAQEALRGPNGLYRAGSTGDWSDLLTPVAGMTESNLVAAQAAYVYPRLAQLADLRGDAAFARRLRALGDDLAGKVAKQWTSRGWYARGYAGGTKRFGTGVIYGEPQPWAILAGLPSKAQSRTLVANILRYLTGIGAPGGPTRIGSSQSPASDDPGVTEKQNPPVGVGDNHAVFVGGAWYAVNGWLTWALGELDGIVPKARELAFSEFRRNTLAARATVYPKHWDGIVSVDDACRSWYSTDPATCGVGLSTAYDTQIMHQPAWSLYDAVMLAGVTPTADGYTITPRLPMARFSLRMGTVGVAAEKRRLRGFVAPARSGALTMRVAPPRGVRASATLAFANGRRVKARAEGALVVFTLPARADRPANWAVSAPGR
jgi:Glycosyl hydrolase 36 superfamily, catalytic domain/Glycosyltransferase family 36